VHIHERRSRLLLGEAEQSPEIARDRCAPREHCGAVWRVLPGFLARHLWRAWSTVERAVLARDEGAPAQAAPLPAPTVRRWRQRLLSSAAVLVAALGTASDVPAIAAVVEQTGYAATRGELVAIFNEQVPSAREPLRAGERLGRLAAIVHRLAPGARLM
jgi:hypothetical protein